MSHTVLLHLQTHAYTYEYSAALSHQLNLTHTRTMFSPLLYSSCSICCRQTHHLCMQLNVVQCSWHCRWIFAKVFSQSGGGGGIFHKGLQSSLNFAYGGSSTYVDCVRAEFLLLLFCFYFLCLNIFSYHTYFMTNLKLMMLMLAAVAFADEFDEKSTYA